MDTPGLGRVVLELGVDGSAKFLGDLAKAKAGAQGIGGSFASAGRDAKLFGHDLSAAGATAEKSLDGVSRGASKVGKALLAAFSVAAAVQAIRQYVAVTGQLTDLSKRLDMSTTDLQKMGYAARLNGADLESVASAAGKLAAKLGEGDASTLSALKTLGLNIDDLRTKSPAEIFFTIADAIAKVPDPLTQSALGVRLFGKSFGDVLPMIKGNLSETAKEAERLGLVLDEKTIAAGDELGDTLDTLKLSGSVLIAQVLTPMVPVLTAVAKWMGDLAGDWIPWLTKGWRALIATGAEWIGTLYRTAAAAADVAAKIPGAKALGFGDRAADLRKTAEEWDRFAASQAAAAFGLDKTTAAARRQKPALDALNVVELRDAYIEAAGGMELLEQRAQGLGLSLGRLMGAKTVSQVKAAIKQLDDATKAGERLKKSQDDLFGRTDITKALEMVRALQGVEQLSKLTAEKQEDLRRAVDAGLAAFQRLGLRAPESLKKVQAALKKTLESTSLAGIQWHLPEVEGLPGLSEELSRLAGTALGSGALITLMPAIESRAREIAEAVQDAAEEEAQAATELVAAWVGEISGFADVFAEVGRELGETAGAIGESISAGIGSAMQIYSGNYAAALMFPVTVGRIWDDIDRRKNQVIAGNRQLVASFIEAEGGVEALRRKLQLTGVEWDAWATHLKRAKDNSRLTEQAIASLTGALDALQARQDAAASAVELTGELVAAWLTPIREARDGLKDAQKAYDELAADPDADPLELEKAGKKVDEFRVKLKSLGPDAQKTFESLEAYAIGAFAAAFSSTGDFYGSLQSMGPLLDDLSEGQEALGLSGSDAISELLGIRDVQRQYSGLLTPLHTATRAVQALGDAGVTSDAAYQALARDAKHTYDTMIAGGVDATTAQALMQPTLQTLWGLWHDNKIAVDDETAAILRQAEEHGIVGEDQQTINDQMLLAFQNLKGAIDDMTTAINDWGTAAEDAFDRFSRARKGAAITGTATPIGSLILPGSPTAGGGETTEPGVGEFVGVALRRHHRGGMVRPQPVGASLWAAGETYARAHTGLLVGRTALAAGEVPILAQRDEGLLSRDVGMPTLGRWALQAMNAGQGPGGGGLDEERLASAIVRAMVTAGAGGGLTFNATFTAAQKERYIRDEIIPGILEVFRQGGAVPQDFRVALGVRS